jgi:3-oxoacyl-[acyl-carrier-protein] synthase-3
MKIAYYLPQKVISNAELATLYEGWTEEKIFSKTGIASRHITEEDETALDLAESAAKKLFEEYQVDPSQIDFIILCTQTPDYKLPTSACILQNRLGIPTSAGALDYNLGCSGFVYGLTLAKGLIVSGVARKVLLVTAETYSKHIHPYDKSVRTIFGDAAAATLIDEASINEIGGFTLGTDGSGYEHLIVPTGGAKRAIKIDAEEFADASDNIRTINNLFMSGVDIFSFTLQIMPRTIKEVLSKNNLTKDEIDLFVFHQANHFMLEKIRKSNAIPQEKFYVNMSDIGNTVSASIPIALKRAEKDGVLKDGMKVMVVGFGVGLSWGATILTWTS